MGTALFTNERLKVLVVDFLLLVSKIEECRVQIFEFLTLDMIAECSRR